MSALTLPLVLLTYLDAHFDLGRSAFYGSAFVLLALAPPGFLLHWAFLRRLREDHGTVWDALGRPTVVYYGSARTGRAVMRFLKNGDYDALGDPPLAGVCRAYRACAAVYTAAFVTMIASWSWLWF
jgi:hypothetical protein